MPLGLPSLLASKVTFIFDGLFFFCFNNPNAAETLWEECQVGILHQAPNHPLRLVIKHSSSPDPLLDISHPGHKLSRLIDNVVFKKRSNAPGQKHVTKRDLDIGDRQRRDLNPTSFRWVIDFENHELHGILLEKQSVKLRPRLHFRNGDFYTEAVNQCIQNKVRFEGEVKFPAELYGFVARTIGAEIILAEEDALLLEIGEQTITLVENSASTTSTCTITFHNNEPYTHPPTGPSDVKFFYNHFLRDPRNIRFDFVPDNPDCNLDKDEQGRALPPFVCYGTSGSQTNDIP